MSGIVLLITDASGVYVPQRFAQENDANDWSIDPASWAWQTILSGPDAEDYWDAWEDVLNNAKQTTEKKGNVWTLHQDGDLWAVCLELMTDEEKVNFGFED